MGFEGNRIDTPWHIGYAKKDEDDSRRHRARCRNYDNESKKCILINIGCVGSSHCMKYNEQPFEEVTLVKRDKEKEVNLFLMDRLSKYRTNSISLIDFCPICRKGLFGCFAKKRGQSFFSWDCHHVMY